MHASTQSESSTERIVGLIRAVRARGARLWPDQGRLRCEAPKGALTHAEVEALKASQAEIVALLQRRAKANAVASSPMPRAAGEPIPLSLSQVLQWHSIRSRERPCQRATASAMRVRGRLSVEVLRRSIDEIVRRHEALRTHIELVEGTPAQQVGEVAHGLLQVTDLTALPKRIAEAEALRLISHCIREPIDLAADSLFALRLLKVQEDDYVLLVALEHIIADACSLSILWRDLFTCYVRGMGGHTPALPEILVQYPDFAVWQKKAYTAWIAKHGAAWNARTKGCPVVRFPVDDAAQKTTGHGWAMAHIPIDLPLKTEWREWCRQRRTTLPMGAFALYVALVLRTCSVPEAVFQFQINGRVSPKVENTLGLFASVLYLRMSLREEDTFVDLTTRVTEEFCSSYANADLCSMATQIPRPEFSRNPAFNWIPPSQSLDLSALDGTADAIDVQPMSFVNPVFENLEMDADPSVAFVDSDSGITGNVHFPLHRFSTQEMERFSANFLALLNAALREPEGRVKDIPFV